MKKIVIAGLVGGLAQFIWGAVSHMALPLGEVGIDVLPDEAALIGAMEGAIAEPGLYLFPGMDMTREVSTAEQEAWAAKYEAGPTGFLVYHPSGRSAVSPAQLGQELLTNIAAALIAAWVLTKIAGPLVSRAALVAGLGLFAWLGWPVEWVFAALIGDYIVKSTMLTLRFRSGRWEKMI